MSIHTLLVEQEPDGAVTHTAFACSGTADDLCRRWCIDGCEESCSATPLPADAEVTAQGPLDGHRFGPLDYCREQTWLAESGTAEDSQAVDEPLRPGLHPIDTEWDGDTYLWSYAEPAEVTP